MPVYEFRCTHCKTTEDIRLSISDRNEDQLCRSCDSIMHRMISASPVNFVGDGWCRARQAKKEPVTRFTDTGSRVKSYE